MAPGLIWKPVHRAVFLTNFTAAPDAPTGGTGLGLSLVKGFVEALGGTVGAANLSGRRRGIYHHTCRSREGTDRVSVSI